MSPIRPQSLFWPGFILLTSWLIARQPSAAVEAPWQEVSRSAEVTVYRRHVAGSDVLAFKAVSVIEAPIAKIVTVMKDTPRRQEWADRVKKAEILHEISPFERVEYVHLSTPWPVKDRDVVYRAIFKFDKQRREIAIQLHSTEDSQRPETKDKIRAVLYSARFVLRPLTAQTTLVLAEAHGDPKGSIPKWIVNRLQKSAPRKTLQNLKKQLAKPGIADDLMTVEFLRSP